MPTLTHTQSASHLARLLDAHRPGHSLAQSFYSDPTIFEEEVRTIWHRQWLFAGLRCELPKAGSWFTVDIAGASIIVANGQDGVIRAFHNTCRHRGSRICNAPSGVSRNLTCPYHQWTYSNTGDLLFARDMGQDFDKSLFSLNPVHLREFAGYLFISLAASPTPFDAFADTVLPYLLPHDLKNARVAFESTIIERANWKLVVENNRECYHCRVSHPELLQTIAEIEDTEDPNCSATFKEKVAVDEARWSKEGLPYKLHRSPEGWQIVRVPMAKGLSFTLNGEPASTRLMGTLPNQDVGSVRMLRLPNTWNHALGDHALAFRVLPIDAQTTAVTTKWLVHKDAVEGVDYDLENLTAVWKATNDQDKTLAENNQLGINSPGYRPGPYSANSEGGVLAFIDWYLATMRSGACSAM